MNGIYGISIDKKMMDKFVDRVVKDNIAIKKEEDGQYGVYGYDFARMYLDYQHNLGNYIENQKINYNDYKINDSKYFDLKVYEKFNTLNDLKEKFDDYIVLGIESQLELYNNILKDISLECIKNNNEKIGAVKKLIGLEIAGNLEKYWYEGGIHNKRKIVELEFIPINLDGLKSIEDKCGFKVIAKSDGDFRNYKDNFKVENLQRQISQYNFYFFNKNSKEFDIYKKLLKDKKTIVVDENNKIHYKEYVSIKKKNVERER